MRNKKQRFFAMITVVVCAVLLTTISLTGCSSKKNEPAGHTDKNEPVVLTLPGEDYGYPTPFQHYSRGPGLYKMTLIFDSLLERGEQGYLPGLAESWTVSDDGKVYTFTLVDHAQWQDGVPLTAEDVVFSFEYFSKYPAVFNYVGSGNEYIIDSMTATDVHTVVIEFKESLANNLMNVGIQRVIPKHIWSDVTDPLSFAGPEAVIGSGPFKLKDYIREQGAYHYVMYEDFWGAEHAVKEIKFVPVSDNVLAFNQGDIDLAIITPDLVAAYENNPEFKVMIDPAFWGYRLLLNMEKRSELQDLNVRHAIAHAIDRDDLIAKVARGAAIPGSYGYLSRSHQMYNPNVADYEFNLEKAKQLLDGLELKLTLITGNNNPEVRIGELLKNNLEQIGISVELKSVDFKTRDDAVKANNYELALFGHGGWGSDPDMLRSNFAAERASDLNPLSYAIPGFSNELINQLAQQQRFETNEQKRIQIVKELQTAIAEQVPVIPLYNTTGYIVFRPAHFDGWKYMFDHHVVDHNRLTYLR